ncbi:MAG TPA: phenylacetyl-CoA:acceptor oxidoreductase [Gammaproteobacteria bacterium]|nr:phenylacetyl-CoA:acceptor oxidoreductase [Gammaproteobacteria bacterium]
MSTGAAGYTPHPRLQSSWDLRAASNFIGGGVGTGLVLTATVVAAFGGLWMPGLLLGLACVAFGLSMVFLELGRPWRAVNVFFHPRTSWMTREGVLSLPLFAAGAGAVAVAWFYGTVAAAPLLALAGLCAAGFLYCQAHILHRARGIPAWSESTLRWVMVATGLTEGVGVFLAITAFAQSAPRALALEVALAVLLAARAGLWLGYARRLRARGAPTRSMRAIDALGARFLWFGHALPAVLLVAGWLVWPFAVELVTAAGLVAAAAGWYAKLMIITRAAASRGFAIPQTPTRGRSASRAGARPGWGGGAS